jgi:pyruvate dehydrogenase E2 component (dihydrolipoamide acetyltransferase)
MAKRVIMPALGMAQETGLIIEWLKNEGDTVTEGEPLLEIETDKTTAVLEAEASGILTHVTAVAGEDVPVAETIAWILSPGEELPAEAKMESAVTAASPTPTPAASASSPPPSMPVMATPVAARIAQENGIDLTLIKPAGNKVTKNDVLAYLDGQKSNGARLLPASPKARRLATEKGYDLKQISGSGPEGAVLTADVLAYQPAVTEAAPAPTPSGISQAWRVMAQRLSESWSTIPHFYLTRDVNATGFIDWLPVARKRSPEKVTYTDLLIKTVAAALRHHPRLNAAWINDDIQYNDVINIGLAVAIEDGLLVPVIHEVDTLSVAGIAEARKGIVSRAHEGKLKLHDLQGGTFTISNLGMYGIDAFNAIVNPPQAAILAVGRITERIVPIEGKPAVCPMMTLTLSLDHRVADGARGAQFLDLLANYIETPLGIL